MPDLFPPDVLGTKKYMAPELAMTVELPLHDPRKNLPNINTDLHSLAVLIYEILFLRHPLEGPRIFSENVTEDDELRYGKSAVFIEDPKDDSNRPDNLWPTIDAVGEDLSTLFIRALCAGLHAPELRPTALEWEDALSRVLDRLIPCTNSGCWRKWFVSLGEKQAVCPYCKTPARKTVFPIMRLFRRYDSGQVQI